ncbi:MAG: hypothetical protein AAGD35_13615 [Actinomycetota bacterium]
MAKKAPTLDTPFRKGEKVMTTVVLDQIEAGTAGKVKLANGLGEWRRYWVRFADGTVRGQVSHAELVRPSQVEAWHQREIDREHEALNAAAAAEEAAAAVESGDDGGGDSALSGLAAQIPAHLLERSRAAKARLTGG